MALPLIPLAVRLAQNAISSPAPTTRIVVPHRSRPVPPVIQRNSTRNYTNNQKTFNKQNNNWQTHNTTNNTTNHFGHAETPPSHTTARGISEVAATSGFALQTWKSLFAQTVPEAKHVITVKAKGAHGTPINNVVHTAIAVALGCVPNSKWSDTTIEISVNNTENEVAFTYTYVPRTLSNAVIDAVGLLQDRVSGKDTSIAEKAKRDAAVGSKVTDPPPPSTVPYLPSSKSYHSNTGPGSFNTSGPASNGTSAGLPSIDSVWTFIKQLLGISDSSFGAGKSGTLKTDKPPHDRQGSAGDFFLPNMWQRTPGLVMAGGEANGNIGQAPEVFKIERNPLKELDLNFAFKLAFIGIPFHRVNGLDCLWSIGRDKIIGNDSFMLSPRRFGKQQLDDEPFQTMLGATMLTKEEAANPTPRIAVGGEDAYAMVAQAFMDPGEKIPRSFSFEIKQKNVDAKTVR
jgi:hypothetical protein